MYHDWADQPIWIKDSLGHVSRQDPVTDRSKSQPGSLEFCGQVLNGGKQCD